MLSLFDFEEVCHFTVESFDPKEESSDEYILSLFERLRFELVENELMPTFGHSASVRRYSDGSISVQPHVGEEQYEYIARLEPGSPDKEKRFSSYTISRMRFNVVEVTKHIVELREQYDESVRVGNRDADREAGLAQNAYESLLADVRRQIPDFVDPWSRQ